MLIPSTIASAAAIVSERHYYSPGLDRYRMDYVIPSGVVWYQSYFIAPNNAIYSHDWDFYPTGSHWFNCNGKYRLKFFDGANNLIAETPEIVTTQIIHEVCLSSVNDTGSGDFNTNYNDNGDGSYDLNWTPMPGAESYDIYKDGQKIGETTGTNFNLPGEGSITVVAKDSEGNTIGQSDINVPTYNGNDGGGGDGGDGGSGCDVCEKLSKLLQCPDWNQYLGDLTGAIRDALPPPPDWDDIADKIGSATIRHLQDYFGPVPDPPTQADIDNLVPTLPNVDNSVPNADIVPIVPAGYEQPLVFDIESGPQIEIVDESKPFQIFEPLHNIEYDDPGVAVIPGDDRNNSGGIQNPENIPLPTPIPEKNVPDPTDDPIPEPGNQGGSIPTPGQIPIGDWQEIPHHKIYD